MPNLIEGGGYWRPLQAQNQLDLQRGQALAIQEHLLQQQGCVPMPNLLVAPAIFAYYSGPQHDATMSVDGRTKAGKLLHSLLNDEQRDELRNVNSFCVRGNKTRKKYRIAISGCLGNVLELNRFGAVHKRFCIHILDSVPMEDHYVAQMLLIKYDEERFLNIARS